MHYLVTSMTSKILFIVQSLENEVVVLKTKINRGGVAASDRSYAEVLHYPSVAPAVQDASSDRAEAWLQGGPVGARLTGPRTLMAKVVFVDIQIDINTNENSKVNIVEVKASILAELDSLMSWRIAESDIPNITIVGPETKHIRMQCL